MFEEILDFKQVVIKTKIASKIIMFEETLDFKQVVTTCYGK
jgi:hypothetical protein